MIKPRCFLGTGVFVALTIFAIVSIAYGTTVKKTNLVELVTQADRIFVGKIINVADGIDPNSDAPYTEITLRLSDKIKGNFPGEVFTFRQFGLIKPRPTADGKYTNLMVTPPGFPTYTVGEEVLLFLCKEGSITGFCSPIGLLQGKFVIKDSRIVNGVGNHELFEGVSLSRVTLTKDEKKLLSAKSGPVSAALFISLVKKIAQKY